MPHPRFEAERCLRETLDALTGDRFAAVAQRHERLAATVACKAAIKAGDQLSPGGDARTVHRPQPHHAAGARRARPLHGRAAVVGRTRAPLWTQVACASSAGPRRRASRPSRSWLAERHGAAVISADSRQIYRGFDIGTAKPTAGRARARAARRHRRARSHRTIFGRRVGARRRSVDRPDAAAGRTPLLVGGTGFYLRALFGPLFDEPELDPARRADAGGRPGADAARRIATVVRGARSRAGAPGAHAAARAPSRSPC